MHNTLDLRPYHIRRPNSPIRSFYAFAGFLTLTAMFATGVLAFYQ